MRIAVTTTTQIHIRNTILMGSIVLIGNMRIMIGGYGSQCL